MRSGARTGTPACREVTASTPLAELTIFEALEPVGQGAKGTVWRGRHRRSGQQVALKLLEPGIRHETVLREVQSVALLDHPGIVRLYDHGHLRNGQAWLAMEWCGGGTLAGTADEWPILRDQLVSLLDALGHAHARHVIHRDLKLANVFVTASGGLKLGDFGMARLGEASAGGILGTPAYMAPEQLEGDAASQGPWSDLYSMGCVIWAKTAGLPPFMGDLKRVKAGRARGLPRFYPTSAVPDGLLPILQRALHPDPTKRFRHAVELASALDALPATSGWMPSVPPEWTMGDDIGSDSRHLDTQLGLLGRRPPPFQGRRAELQRLWREVVAASEGNTARVVWIGGPEGVGKTRVAERVAQQVSMLGLGRWQRVQTVDTGAIEAWATGLVDVVIVAAPPDARADDLRVSMDAVRRPVLFLVLHTGNRGIELAPLPASQVHRILAATLPLTMASRAHLVDLAQGLPGDAIEELSTRHHRDGLTPTADGFEFAIDAPSTQQPSGSALVLAALGGRASLQTWTAACRENGVEVRLSTLVSEGLVRLDAHEHVRLVRPSRYDALLLALRGTRQAQAMWRAVHPHIPADTPARARGLLLAGQPEAAAQTWVAVARQARSRMEDGRGLWAAEEALAVDGVSDDTRLDACFEKMRGMIRTGVGGQALFAVLDACEAELDRPRFQAMRSRILILEAGLRKDLPSAYAAVDGAMDELAGWPARERETFRLTAAEILAQAGEPERAAAEVQTVLENAEGELRGRALYVRANQHFSEENLELADRDLTEAEDLATEGLLRLHMAMLRLNLMARRGDLNEALVVARRVQREMASHPRHRSLAEINVLSLMASTGDWDGVAELGGRMRYDPMILKVAWRRAIALGLFGAATRANEDIGVFVDFYRSLGEAVPADFRSTAARIVQRAPELPCAQALAEILEPEA